MHTKGMWLKRWRTMHACRSEVGGVNACVHAKGSYEQRHYNDGSEGLEGEKEEEAQVK